MKSHAGTILAFLNRMRGAQIIMKHGLKTSMNGDFSENYDQTDDVYYVTFKTGEPSCCVEIDDILLLEVGLYSGLPTGFRILNFSKNRIHNVKVLVHKAREFLAEKQPQDDLPDRAAFFEAALGKVLHT